MMMKKIVLVLSIAALILSGCGMNSANDQSMQASEDSSFESELSQVVFDDSEKLNGKLSLYKSNLYFADVLVPHRYLIIGESSVVLVQLFSDMETVTEIPFDAVSRKESKTVGTFGMIEIFDKAGKEISFNAKPDDMPDIIESIQ